MNPADPVCSPTSAPSWSTSGPGDRLPASSLAKRVAIVATGDEADLLALGLLGRDQAKATSHVAHLGLGQIAQREPGVRQLVLAQAVQEVGLVLVRVAGPKQARRAVGADVLAGVVAGRDRLAVVQMPCPTQQGAELDVRVAVHAWARRRTAQVGIQERLHDPGVELALEVHDVERDVELGRHPAGVVGRIGRATALLHLGIAVGDVVEAHPDADDLVALRVQDRRCHGRIHAAGHRDQDPAHAGTPWPSGSAATAIVPIRMEAMTRGTTSLAVAISSSVVVRPRDRRSAPLASSSG